MDFSFLLIIALIPIIARGTQIYSTNRQVERKKGSWKELAAATNMQFVPAGHLFNSSRIEGVYRGFRVFIKTFRKNTGGASDEMWTEVRLTIPNTSTYNPNDKPDIGDVEHFLNRNKSILPYFDRSLEIRGHEVLYREGQVRSNVYKFQAIIDYLCDLAQIYTRAIRLGGEAVPILLPIAVDNTNPLKSVALRLLREIESFTASEFASRLETIRCKQCLTSFSSHKIKIGRMSSAAYYACRQCKKSHAYYEKLSPIFVLDTHMKDKFVQQDHFLYVNGLKRRKLFDFDEVIIDHASDKEVASFAIRIGNDTDAFRAERYSKMPCTVMESCEISENTMHMLKRVFGRVQVKNSA